jgi:hypothetical protein
VELTVAWTTISRAAVSADLSGSQGVLADFDSRFWAVTDHDEVERGRCERKGRERNEHSQSDPQAFCGRKKRRETKERSGSTCSLDRARFLWQATASCDSHCGHLSFLSFLSANPSLSVSSNGIAGKGNPCHSECQCQGPGAPGPYRVEDVGALRAHAELWRVGSDFTVSASIR